MRSRSAEMDWLNVPHLRQSEAGWCLPARVAMVAAYWQQPLAQADVARWLDTRGVGTPASRIERLAQRGFKVIYRTGSLAELEVWLAQHSFSAYRGAAVLASGHAPCSRPGRPRSRPGLPA